MGGRSGLGTRTVRRLTAVVPDDVGPQFALGELGRSMGVGTCAALPTKYDRAIENLGKCVTGRHGAAMK